MHQVFSFLDDYKKDHRPFLLALSGGPDSLLLFHLLLEYGHPFAVAHLDHRWYEASKGEADQLRKLCQEHKIDFFLQTLDPDQIKGNLEDECRKLRYTYFYKVFKQGYQAVLLAHQANDQAETLLKRVLEGSSLAAFSSIKPISYYNEMPVLRPLLSLPRKKILLEIDNRNLKPFADPTNQDVSHLRARMRKEILPYLNKSFGKEIAPSLCRVAKEALELDQYLSVVYEEFKKQIISGVFGVLLDFNKEKMPHPFILKAVVKRFALDAGVVLSSTDLSKAVYQLIGKSANKWIHSMFYVDRGRLFFIEGGSKMGDGSHFIRFGTSTWGSWDVVVTSSNEEYIEKTHWLDVWKGEVVFSVPEGNYKLSPCCGLDKWWTKHKVPAFFRTQVPVLLRENDVYREFLTGKLRFNECKRFIQIRLSTNKSKNQSNVDSILSPC